MGGKSHADNDEVVEEQKRQAEEARRKEDLRQARIKTGLTKIGYAFEGRPITAPTSTAFDWKKYTAKSALPPGFKRVQVNAAGKAVPDTPGQAATGVTATALPHAGEPGVGGSPGTATLTPGHAATAATAAPGTTTAIMGPDGRIYRPGQAFNYTWNKPTGGRKGGFGKGFYDEYKNSILDYYDPQVASQYHDATDELTYRLARAGTLQSSAGSDEVADLAEQNALSKAGIANQADTATGDLKAKVASEKQKAISQLYATENPEVAANQALASVRDISLQEPDLSPLTQLFNIAAIGGANILKGFNNRSQVDQFNAGLPSGPGASRNYGSA
jgi:hypothetical protein